jgi:serine/threonine protein phosphatase 1
MGVIAIGDIHGSRRALEALVAEVKPGAEDQLVFLGDYVDRGRDSRGVIEFLIDLSKRQRCVFLRGNHEVMMLQSRGDGATTTTWRFCGGSETLRSYDYWGEDAWWDFIPKTHWDFLKETRRYFETERQIFVHGCVDPNLEMEEQQDSILFWERFEEIRPHRSGKKIICGHTPDLDGEIQDVGFAVCIDTAAALGGWLTALDVDSGWVWQANEKGEQRRGKMVKG